MWRREGGERKKKKRKTGHRRCKRGSKKGNGVGKGWNGEERKGKGGRGGGTKSASGARVSNILFLLALAKPRERYRVLHPVFGISPL